MLRLAVLLLGLGVASSPCAEQSDERLLQSVVLTPNSQVLLVVDQLAADALVKVENSAGQRYQNSLPQRYGLGAVFLFETSSLPITARVSLLRNERSDLPTTAKVRLIPVLDEGNRQTLKTWARSLQKWSEGGEQQRVASIAEQKLALSELPKSHPLAVHLLDTYLASLLAMESYQELIRYGVETYRSSADGYSSRYVVLDTALAEAYRKIGRYDASLGYYENALRYKREFASLLLWEKLRVLDLKSGHGTALVLSSKQTGNEDQLHRGGQLLRSVVESAEGLGGFKLVAQANNSLGAYYAFKGMEKKSEQAFLDSISSHRLAGSTDGLVDSLNNVSVVYHRRGRYSKALAALNEALSYESSKPLRPMRATLTLNLAGNYMMLGKYGLAQTSSRLSRESYLSVGDRLSGARACLVQAEATRLLGDFDDALKLNHTCLGEFIGVLNAKGSHRHQSADLAQSYIQLARSHLALDEVDQALDFALMAAKYGLVQEEEVSEDFMPDSDLQIDILGLLATVSRADKNMENFHRYQRVLSNYFSSESKLGLHPIQHVEFLERSILANLGDENLTLVKLELEELVSKIEEVQFTLDSRSLAPAWAARMADVHYRVLANYGDYAFDCDNKELQVQLFEFLERVSATSLRQSRVFSRRESFWEYSSLQESLLARLEAEEFAVANASDQLQLEQAIRKSMEAQSAAFSGSTTIEKSDRKILSIPEVMASLDEGEVAIRFFISPARSFYFLITTEQWAMGTGLGREEVIKRSKQMLNDIKRRSGGFKRSILSITDLIQTPTPLPKNISRIVYVVSGGLQDFPLGLANISEVENSYSPVAEKIDIVRTYSLSDYFGVGESNERSYQTDIAIFADPSFRSKKHLLNSSKEEGILRSWGESLQPLPWTRREAQSIKRLFSDKNISLASGSEATSAELLSSEMLSSRILHIATHGYFNEKTPDIVGLATAPDENDSSGFLTLSRLLNKPFYSNLVVISGCETSLGQDLKSEGANSLSRGVIAQGAGAVIGTVWPVPDRPTALFMGNFYKELRANNGDASSALSKAKRQFLNTPRFRHPYYWAGFELTSANRKIDANVFR